MSAYEKTIIVGNVGRKPEYRDTRNGNKLCSFSVAVTTRWTDKQTQERREKTNWYNVTCWGNLADIASQYVTKGAKVMVEGAVVANAYMRQDGQPKASLELTANTFVLMGGDPQSDDSPSNNPNDIPF